MWRVCCDARCFVMVECGADHGADALFSTMPMIVAAPDRERWLHGAMQDIAALGRPCPTERLRIGLPRPAALTARSAQL